MKKQKILVVDDNPTGIHALLAILKPDYTVFIATDGESALQKAATDPKPDIILLDIVMPEMDGYEVCRRLKKNKSTKNIPVIFISALDDSGDEEKGLNLGAIDYIHKPINSAIVKTRLKNHLALVESHKKVRRQNMELKEVVKLREDVERITRHDLKSPLNVIIAYPQLIVADDNLTMEQIEILNEIEAAGYKMLDMINRSLDLYKMETGNYHLKAVSLNLMTVLENVISENKESTLQRQLTISIDNKELTEKFVEGELLLCYTLFGNLIKNAIDASPEEREIKILLTDEEDCVAIKISNSGSVPEEIRGHFFEKYVTFGKKNGTGLGTYSAFLSTKTQKGSIDLDTSKDSMTSVIVRLPKAEP